MMPPLTYLLAQTLIEYGKTHPLPPERETRPADNSASRVLWELGLALVVALSGAALVTVVLRGYGIG